jgi:hypothetical protein
MANMNEIDQLKNRLQVLEDFVRSLEASHSIPLNIDQAFRARFTNPITSQITKAASSENRTVNEGGGASYDVLKAPDGFDQRFDPLTGQTKYYPWFNLS